MAHRIPAITQQRAGHDWQSGNDLAQGKNQGPPFLPRHAGGRGSLQGAGGGPCLSRQGPHACAARDVERVAGIVGASPADTDKLSPSGSASAARRHSSCRRGGLSNRTYPHIGRIVGHLRGAATSRWPGGRVKQLLMHEGEASEYGGTPTPRRGTAPLRASPSPGAEANRLSAGGAMDPPP